MVCGALKSCIVNLTHSPTLYNDEIFHSDVRLLTILYSIVTFIKINFYIFKRILFFSFNTTHKYYPATM